MTRHARNELIATLLADSPRTAAMVATLLEKEDLLRAFPAGVVELHFGPDKVQSHLRASLECRRLTKM